MNDGIVTLILQWMLLICTWMGLFDSSLRTIRLSRAKMLAILTAFLFCSFANWQLYFMPVEVNVSGVLLPFLLSAWIYGRQRVRNKEYILAASILCSCVILFMRKILFWDPILLVLDQLFLIPIVSISLIMLVARDRMQQLFIILFALPLSDLLYVCSNLSLLSQYKLGGAGSLEAQDFLWVSIGCWLTAIFVWDMSKKTVKLTMKPLLPMLKSKIKSRI